MKKHLAEILVAGVLFFMALSIAPNFMVWWRSNSNPEDWFVVNQIYVTDHQQNEEPIFTYDRTIKKPFYGTWKVEVQVVEQGKMYTICDGEGNNEYKPEHTLPPDADMEWFVGTRCNLQPGTYRLAAYWHINVPNYPVMKYEAVSNVFRVTEQPLPK